MNRIFVFLMVCAFAKAYSQEISPQTSVVDIEKIASVLSFDVDSKSVSGKVVVTFKMLKDASEVKLDAKHMQVIDRTPLFDIKANESHIVFQGGFEAGGRYKAHFDYTAVPKQALYFVNNQGSPQIWTQGQGKYTSHWLPSIDDMNDKIEFDFKFTDREGKVFITNGQFQELYKDYGVVDYNFDMTLPISSYLVAFATGDYEVKTEISTSGVPLEYYYYPQDTLKVESTYRHSKQLFDFMEGVIGVSYPWQVYKQVPVKDFLYAGMENASCTIFSDSFMVDEIGFIDRNYVNVNAHELAHQWFGDMVTETKSDHHWLHEGFATYYALLAEREIFGDDYFYYKLYESAEQLRELSDQGKGQQLVAAGGSSLTYYQKGAWAIHILRELVGEDIFTQAVKNYLTKHAFSNVTTNDFMTEVATLTTVNLDDYEKKWLYQSAFQAEDALTSLKKSTFMREYFELQALRSVPFSQKETQLEKALTFPNDYLGQEAVYQLAGEDIARSLPLYQKVFESENILVRQAIITSLENIPVALREMVMSLLSDKSYVTREQALLKLWLTYMNIGTPDARNLQVELLEKTKNDFGFSDGNIRTLWLVLAMATPDYENGSKVIFHDELKGYTAPEQPFQLRQNTFQYLFQIQWYEPETLQNLLEACVHHNWRFRESARGILKQLLLKKEFSEMVSELLPTLPEKEKAYLESVTTD